MQLILSLIIIFFIGGVIGYLIELTYRSIVSKELINPGFLHGPFLPIYGFGLLILFFLCEIPINFPYEWLNVLTRILLIFFSLTLIEYIGGLLFIKILNIKLWDYSNQKGNIQGIICPLFSLIWGIIGTAYYFFIHPLILSLLKITNNNSVIIFLSGLFMGIFIIDFISSMHIGKKVGDELRKLKYSLSYDKLKLSIKKYCDAHHLKHHFFHPFHKNIDHIKKTIQ